VGEKTGPRGKIAQSHLSFSLNFFSQILFSDLIFFGGIICFWWASCLLDRQALYHLSHSTSPFFVCMLGIFKIGSHELFAQTGFEP
jgi:hypothetical protein